MTDESATLGNVTDGADKLDAILASLERRSVKQERLRREFDETMVRLHEANTELLRQRAVRARRLRWLGF